MSNKSKILILGIILMLLATSVLAQNQQMGSQNEIPIPTQAQEEIKSQVKGLENAVLQIRNEEQKQQLTQVMEKIQEKKKEQLEKLEQLEFKEVNGKVIAEGKSEAKFLGFIPFKRTYTYQIQEDGEVIRNKSAFEFLWRNAEGVD